MVRIGYSILGIGICGWLVFLFYDASKTPFSRAGFSDSIQETQENSPYIMRDTTHEYEQEQSLQAVYTQAYHEVSRVIDDTQPSLLKPLQEVSAPSESTAHIDTMSASMLEILHKRSQDVQVAHARILQLLKEHRFHKAYQQYAILQKSGISIVLDPYTYLYMFLHSPEVSPTQPTSIEKFRQSVLEYAQQQQISQDDQYFYLGLIDVWNGRWEQARSHFTQADGSMHQQVLQSLYAMYATLDKQRDIPDTYRHAMIALTLLKNGYFAVAKQVALQVVLVDDAYILPYQILAYSDFLAHNHRSAIEYFMKLVNIDPTQKDVYTFFVAIAYYMLDDYKNALLYLTQVQAKHLLADVARYRIIMYREMGNYPKQVETWQTLFAQTTFSDTDMYTYIYDTFWDPFIKDKGYLLHNTNPQLAQIILSQCVQKVENADICRLGELGFDMIHKQRDSMERVAQELAQVYFTPYLLDLLGDRAVVKGDLIRAQELYAQAHALASDEDYVYRLTQKLLSVQ